MLDSIEHLTTRIVDGFERDKERARQQRIQARASLTSKQLGFKPPESQPEIAIPAEFSKCEECQAALEARAPNHTHDMLVHANHKQGFYDWLLTHPNGNAAT